MDGGAGATWNEDYDDGEYSPEVDYAEEWSEAEIMARELCLALARAGVADDVRALRVRPHMSKTGQPWVKLSTRSAELLKKYLASRDACPK
ncbi:hypothetical protein ABZ746_18440 [Streptomyces sp. NPDC020096]